MSQVPAGEPGSAGGPPPRVSIGLPVYNGERFLAEAIESVLAQTFTDFELVICDNASTDGTAEVCQRYADADSRIRYFRNPENIGAARNFNRTFTLSRGEMFKWLSRDDLMAPDFLAFTVAALDANPGAVAAYPQALSIDGEGNVLHRSAHSVPIAAQADPVQRFKLFREEQDFRHGVRAWPMLYVFALLRSSAMRNTHLIEPYINSDGNFVFELVLAGPMVEVPRDLMSFRHHADSYSVYALSDRQRQQFFNPSRKHGRLSLPSSYKLHYEYLKSILRARITPRQKAEILFYNLTWSRRRRQLLAAGSIEGSALTPAS